MSEHSVDGYDVWEFFKKKVDKFINDGLTPEKVCNKIETIKQVKIFTGREEEFEYMRKKLITGFSRCR